MTQNRRNWLKQSSVMALGLGVSLRSLANEEGLPKQFGSEQELINLGSNENPYGLSPMSKKAIVENLDSANRYQFNISSLKNFKKKIAEYYKLVEENLLITAGSGEALNLLARYFADGNIVAANPTFGILPNTAKKIGAKVIEVPLTYDKVHDLNTMLKAIDNKTKLVYICNPANPTSTILPSATLKDFCTEASKKTKVLIDEAYIDYIETKDNESMFSLINNNPNIIVIRTFSKIHGMAGLRVGFVAAHPSFIETLRERYFDNAHFCCSVLSQAAVLASIKDEEHQNISRRKNALTRKFITDELRKLNYRYADSHTNFVFFQLKNFKADFAKEMLEKHNIVLRSNNYDDGNWCRVSIGFMYEIKKFMQIFKEKYV